MGSSGNVPASGGAPGAREEGERRRAPRTRAWLRRRRKPLRFGVLLFVMALVIEYLVVPELVGASKDLYLLGQINAAWVAAGVVLEGLSLFCYAVLTKVLLPGKGHKPSLSVLFRIDLSAAAVAHVIPAGTLGTAALGYKLFTDEGISGNDATVMMAAKGIGSTVVLNVLLWVSLVVSIPLAGFQPIYGTVAIIGTVVLLGVAALVVGVTRGAGLASRLLRALGDKLPFVNGEQVERAVLEGAKSFSLLARDKRVMAWALLWASLNWMLDAASLWCFVAAFGHLANPVELFAAYGIANVAGALPLTPGGLGVVDSITPLLLVGFGVTRSVATLGVLGWRMVNFWLPIPTGALAYVSLKVKPDAGMRAMRSAFSGLFGGGREAVGDMPEVPEVPGVPTVAGAAADGAGRAGPDVVSPGGAGMNRASTDGTGPGAAPDGSPNGDSAGKPAGLSGDSRAESPAEKRSR
jgi:uncharacterized protein (TIRG00374 family)